MDFSSSFTVQKLLKLWTELLWDPLVILAGFAKPANDLLF